MHKSILFFVFFSVCLHALYNPFFREYKAPKKVVEEKVVVVKEKAKPNVPLQTIEIKFIGYIESNKGKFALVTFDGHNIVVKKNDPLYSGSKMFKVAKITTNYILVRDPNFKIQTIYFTTESMNRNGVNNVL